MLVHSLQQVPFIQHLASSIQHPISNIHCRIRSPSLPVSISSPPNHSTRHPKPDTNTKTRTHLTPHKNSSPPQQPHPGPLCPKPPHPKPTQQLLRRRPPGRPNPRCHRPARDRTARSPTLGCLGRRFSDERGRRRLRPRFGLRLRLGWCYRFLGGGTGAETAA